MSRSERRAETALWWIRRDLRLTANPALQRALQDGFRVIPVYILDPALLGSDRLGTARKRFFLENLASLQDDLEQAGGTLVLRSGQPVQALGQLIQQSGAVRIYAEEDYSPYARARDRRVAAQQDLRLVQGLTIAHPEQIRTNAGDPYQVYSYYRKKWKRQFFESLRNPGAPELEPSFFDHELASEELPDREPADLPEGFPPGSSAAREKLDRFTRGSQPAIYRYARDRDRPDREGTSQLSPYLHFGALSIQEAFQAGLEALDRSADQGQRQGAETWLDELIWREFYQMILYHHPRVLQENFREKYSRLTWRNDREFFQRWKEGRTGYPLVDAGMRQLLAEGWMHNRVRMVSASFLVKDLLIDWRWGENWFMEQLLDADLAANNGGWQWVAGTGTDAAPYFRIFNPTSQAEKHDPQGVYIRTYLPELGQVPDQFIHQPWKMPESVQDQINCRIGAEYPAPIVDHQQARERTLEVYQLAGEE
jgi:deoxyribodipyrimidine photo-lyase